MRLADNLAKLGNINAARSALGRTVLGLEMLSKCASRDCLAITQRNLAALDTLFEVVQRGPGIPGRALGDWGERAKRYGIYLGLREASRSSDQYGEWVATIREAHETVGLALGRVGDSGVPSIDPDALSNIDSLARELERIHQAVVCNTAAESNELEMMLRGA